MTIPEIVRRLDRLGFWQEHGLPATRAERAAFLQSAFDSYHDVREEKVWVRRGDKYKHAGKLTDADRAKLQMVDDEASTPSGQQESSAETGEVGATLHLSPIASLPKQYVMKLPARVSLDNLVRVDRYTCIDAKLRQIVEASKTRPAWLKAWERSMRGRRGLIKPGGEQEANPAEPLAVWQAVREAGSVPEDAAFYLIADQIKFMTEVLIGEAINEIDRCMDKLYAEHGFEDWRAEAHRDSEDFLDYATRFPLGWDRLYHGMMQEHGEGDMARLYRTDRERFEERIAAGELFFYPGRAAPQEAPKALPQWVTEFHDAISRSGCIVPLGRGRPKSQVRFGRYRGQPEVWLKVTPTETIRGTRGGEVVAGSFFLDIERLRGVFDEVTASAWQPLPTSLPAHVAIKGTYRGHQFVLRILRAHKRVD
jgi:hypothetical protein